MFVQYGVHLGVGFLTAPRTENQSRKSSEAEKRPPETQGEANQRLA